MGLNIKNPETHALDQAREAHRLLKVLADKGVLSPQDKPLFDVLNQALGQPAKP